MTDERSVVDALRDTDKIRGAGVVRSDGTFLVSDFPDTEDPGHIAAVAASNVGTCDKLGEGFKAGAIDSILITAEEGLILSHRIDGERFVTVIADPDMDPDTLREAVRDAVARLN